MICTNSVTKACFVYCEIGTRSNNTGADLPIRRLEAVALYPILISHASIAKNVSALESVGIRKHNPAGRRHHATWGKGTRRSFLRPYIHGVHGRKGIPGAPTSCEKTTGSGRGMCKTGL